MQIETMPYEWIKAPLALDYVSGRPNDFSAIQRICERAYHGLIVAKAERIVAGEQEEEDRIIGKGFWWAKGHEALEQDWRVGDFSTWIEQKHEVKAFGVSFDFVAISDVVPAEALGPKAASLIPTKRPGRSDISVTTRLGAQLPTGRYALRGTGQAYSSMEITRFTSSVLKPTADGRRQPGRTATS